MKCNNCGFAAWVEPDHNLEEMKVNGYSTRRYCPSCGERLAGDEPGGADE